jgi:hypothetical protein
VGSDSGELPPSPPRNPLTKHSYSVLFVSKPRLPSPQRRRAPPISQFRLPLRLAGYWATAAFNFTSVGQSNRTYAVEFLTRTEHLDQLDQR